MARFVSQTGRDFIQRPKVLVLLRHIEILRAADGIQPAEGAAVERREAEAVYQRHIRFRRAGDNAFFRAADDFVNHRDHHAGDNLFIAEIALRLADFGQQAVDGSIFFFLRLTFAVFFIAPEAEAVLLPETIGVKQGVDSVAIIFLHPLREARRHDRLSMVRGIDADHVQQISWAHRPAKLFLHHFVDFAEIRPVAQQLAKSGEVGE